MNVLTQKVLVLNKGWTPIKLITVKAALCILTKSEDNGEPKAKIIDHAQGYREFTWKDWSDLQSESMDEIIRGGSRSYKMFRTIKLLNYSKFPNHASKFNRAGIYKRDGNRCQYCGKGTPQISLSELSLDHVTPRSKGGLTTWENCVIACTNCNRKKANRSLHESGMAFFNKGYKPVKPKFTLFAREDLIQFKDWQNFFDHMYWTVELKNDN